MNQAEQTSFVLNFIVLADNVCLWDILMSVTWSKTTMFNKMSESAW